MEERVAATMVAVVREADAVGFGAGSEDLKEEQMEETNKADAMAEEKMEAGDLVGVSAAASAEAATEVKTDYQSPPSCSQRNPARRCEDQ